MSVGSEKLVQPIEARDKKWLENKLQLDLSEVSPEQRRKKKKASKKEKSQMIDRLYGKVYKEQQSQSPRREKSKEEALRSGWRSHGAECPVSPHRQKVSKKRLDISERLHRGHTRSTDRSWIDSEQEKHQQLLYPGQPDCKQVRFNTIHILSGGQPQPGAAEILQTTQYIPKSEQRSRARSMRSSKLNSSTAGVVNSPFDDEETFEESIVLHEDMSMSSRKDSMSTRSRPPDLASDATYSSSSRESSVVRRRETRRPSTAWSSTSSASTDTEDELSPRYKRYFSTLTSQSRATSYTADHTTEYDQSTDTTSEAATAATSEVSKQFFECSATIIGTEHLDLNTTQASLSFCAMSESGYNS